MSTLRQVLAGSLTVLAILSTPRAEAGICNYVIDALSGGRISSAAFESARFSLSVAFDPKASESTRQLHRNRLLEVKDPATLRLVGDVMMEKFLKPMGRGEADHSVDTLIWASQLYPRALAISVRNAEDFARYPNLKPYRDSLEAVAILAPGLLTMGAMRTNGPFSRENLLSSANGTPMDVVGALVPAFGTTIKSENSVEVVTAVETIADFVRHEGLARDRPEVRTMALEALKITSEKLEQLYTPDYVMRRVLAIQAQAIREGVSYDTVKGYEEENHRTAAALQSIRQLFGVGQKLSDTDVVTRLEAELKNAERRDRDKVKRNLGFAKSDSPVLKELAKTFLMTIDDLNAPISEEP
ncbi:MAG TPA: hypothetical protein VM901_08180 [Bdellovibrionota bacterium]|jgi:hypothetical protein|nr:hypothetical protein [Bdellovibrionota bacterium]